MIENRRSKRIVCSVALTVSVGATDLQAQSGVINAHGALMLSPEPIPEGTLVSLFNRKTGERVEATVIWTGLKPLTPLMSPTETFVASTLYKLGVEFRKPAPNFWGSDYKP